MAQPAVEHPVRTALQLHQSGRIREAEQVYRQVLAREPENPDALHLLGLVAYQLGQLVDAVQLIRRTTELRPSAPEPFNNLAAALQEKGDLDEAFAACRRAIALRPNYPEAFGNLAHLFKTTGQIEQAIAAYRQALALQRSFSEAHGSLVNCLHFLPGIDPRMIAAEHKAWGMRYAEPFKQFIKPHANARDPDRRLRVGYVSADFRDHPVGRFLLPLLANHDRAHVEVFCYANRFYADALTTRLQSASDHWTAIAALTDEQAAEKIRADGIDLLVELSGHTAGSRLFVFARKPAPIQISYLGYPNTSGMSVIDYRFTDALTDPPGAHDGDFLESLYRLPQTNWCCPEPPNTAPVSMLPAIERGYVTFGSFNNFSKTTEPMLQLWAKILRGLPGSRLMLKGAALGVESVSARVRKLFADQGIDAGRLTLLRSTPDHSSHLALYDQMDIALDTFPYHGTTTTCEALLQGVPVITLAGNSHVSRVGVSMLTNVGLPDLIAGSMDEYVNLAMTLAGDLPRLAALRISLRERMRKSPIMDGPAFARHVEVAYRQMWCKWCGQSSAMP